MKAIEFEGQTMIFAENQDEYENLPARVDGNGVVTCCLGLEEDELVEALKAMSLQITRLTFDDPAQPLKVAVFKPDFPVSNRDFICKPDLYPEEGDKEGKVLFNIILESEELEELAKTKCFWLSTATFKGPLQPIVLSCCGS
jgi:hypothetical protein